MIAVVSISKGMWAVKLGSSAIALCHKMFHFLTGEGGCWLMYIDLYIGYSIVVVW